MPLPLMPPPASTTQGRKVTACDLGYTISEGILFTSNQKVKVDDTRYLELKHFSAIDMESGRMRRRAQEKGRSVQVVRAFADGA